MKAKLALALAVVAVAVASSATIGTASAKTSGASMQLGFGPCLQLGGGCCVDPKAGCCIDISFTDGSGPSAFSNPCGARDHHSHPSDHPIQENDVFLCYSKTGDPGVWPSDEAAMLLGEGYWLPYAVPGNVDGGTNLGDFHLTCNIDALKTTGGFIDGAGASGDQVAQTNTSGLYPVGAS